MAYEHDADDYPEDYAPDQTTLHEPYDDDAEREAHEEDLAAQNAVEDAKYDAMMPELGSIEFGSAESLKTLGLLQAHSLMAVADQLADVLSLLKQERGRQSFAERLAEDAIARLDRIEGRGTSFPIGVGSVSPTDPAALGAWLRGLPDGSALRAHADGHGARGDVWQRDIGIEHGHRAPDREFPAMMCANGGALFEISDGRMESDIDGPGGLRELADYYAPFTVLALGDGTQDGGTDD